MTENEYADVKVEHGFSAIEVQMVFGVFALGYGLKKWIGAGIALISTSVLLCLINDWDEIMGE